MVSAIGAVIFIATDLYQEESLTRVQEANLNQAKAVGDKIFSSFEDATRNMRLMAQFTTNSTQRDEAMRGIENTLQGLDALISFFAYRIDEKGQLINEYAVVNDTALGEFSLSKEQIQVLPEKQIQELQYAKSEEVIFVNSSEYLNRPLYSISFLSQREFEIKEGDHPLTGRWLFRSEMRQSQILALLFNEKKITSYIVDSSGKLIAHSDPEIAKSIYKGISFRGNPLVEIILSSRLPGKQMEYVDEDEEIYLAAYKKIPLAGLAVIAEKSKTTALATIRQVQYRSVLVMIIVVCLAFFINYYFSHNLTQPIHSLYAATEKIVEGNYDVNLGRTSSDEIGALSVAFNDMASGLKEREKIKIAFNKFHSKEVANKLLSGEIRLGGERRLSTVFFSDIRGFTAMSEKMSPDQVVTMLNEYMTEMVRIIYKWNGVVDKYVGDAIMAIWGAPESSPDDAYNAVRASLEMRDFMCEFNERRKAEGKPELLIGMGLHTGEVLAGNIGSEQRLEYTVIGDTVNQAARIEAANKAVQADLLISKDTFSLVKDRGIVAGPEVAITAKGKSENLIVHQVIGYETPAGDLQTSLGQEKIDFIYQQKAVETKSEEKVQAANLGPEVSSNQNFPDPPNLDQIDLVRERPKPPPPKAPKKSESIFFVLPNPESDQQDGPLSIEEIKLRVMQGIYSSSEAYVYQPDDEEMQLIRDHQAFNRRESVQASIQVPLPGQDILSKAYIDEWYVYGATGESLGPYTRDQLREALENGFLTRTTYVWQTGLDSWIYLYQVPGLDRRVS